MLVAEADLAIQARLLEVDDLVADGGPDGWERQALNVEVLQVIKGSASQGEQLRFVQHGHGTPKYRRGDEALLFLRDISRSRELAGLGSKKGLRWYSSQEHDDDYVLSGQSGDSTVSAARRYAAIEEMLPEQRDAALRKITVTLLASKLPRLSRSALRDLVKAPDAPLVTRADVGALMKVVDDPQRPIDLRLGLLTELQRRGLVDGDARWVRLLRESRGAERLPVIQAAGAHPSPAVNAELVRILESPDLASSAAAAVALGTPGNTEAVAPLRQALSSRDSRLAMAAIRGLGSVGTPEARAALRSAAESHPDSKVRRRAQAELRLLDSRRIR